MVSLLVDFMPKRSLRTDILKIPPCGHKATMSLHVTVIRIMTYQAENPLYKTKYHIIPNKRTYPNKGTLLFYKTGRISYVSRLF